MYQVKVNNASKPRIVVLLAVIVVLALSLLAIRLFVTTPSDAAPGNAVVPPDSMDTAQGAARGTLRSLKLHRRSRAAQQAAPVVTDL